MRIIGGLYRGKKLLSPRSANIRPTADQAREAVFNILSSRLDKPWNELSMADVFTGSGPLKPYPAACATQRWSTST